MERPCIEYISACACCEVYGEFVKSLGEQYQGKVAVKIYKAGEDFEYIKKYGAVSKSMLVINQSKAVTKLNKENIRKAFEEALRS